MNVFKFFASVFLVFVMAGAMAFEGVDHLTVGMISFWSYLVGRIR